MRSQLKRAKGRLDSHDLQLHSSLLAILNDKDDGPETMEILEKLAEKLDLRTPGAIRQENRALQEMMLEKDNSDDDGCEHDLSFQQLFTVLRKLTSILPSEDTDDETPELDRVNIAAGVFIPKGAKHHSEVRAGVGLERRGAQPVDVGGPVAEKGKLLVVPDDFKCPISLDLMKDPVIVATGQVSEGSHPFYCLC